MKILFKRKSNTFSIEPNKLTNYLQIENFDKQHIFPLDDIFVPTLFSFWADVVFKNIRRIWLIAKPLPGKYSKTEILPKLRYIQSGSTCLADVAPKRKYVGIRSISKTEVL